jgi:selenide,water dikinase
VHDLTRNSTARPGDRLFLTKPLGLGIVSTAIKRGVADEDLVDVAVSLMTTTNRAAAEAMREAGVSAATDVTGFGLLGHLGRMLESSGVAARLDAAAVPLLDPRVLELARADVIPGGTKRNLAHVRPIVDFEEATPPEQAILADAQTSGGLLIATSRPEALAGVLRATGLDAAEIGEVVEGPAGRIEVRGALSE